MKRAYVTFIIKNDRYVCGALVLAYGLLKQCVEADLICLVTNEISREAVKALSLVYTRVIEVESILIDHPNDQGRSDRHLLFTRFQALRLGCDGDLGCDYEKIVLIDCDVLPIKDYDSLFELEAPAGIINECKDNWYGDLVFDGGKTVWHKVYDPICPHGEMIPEHITNRVWNDCDNLGVNACLWVLEPNMVDYNRLLTMMDDTVVYEKLKAFNWPEMQFATYFWSGKWRSVDLRYCAYNGQPNISQIYGTHFAGYKPWHDQDRKVLKRYMAYEDFQLWYKHLYELVVYIYPSMMSISNVKRMIRFYETFYMA